MKISKAILPFSAFSCLSVSLNAATILNPSFEATVNPDPRLTTHHSSR